MRKATHRGTCQVCGRLQKLPGDVLSLHGYTVEWAVFEGQCYGSCGQPFELSKDLISIVILRAKGKVKSITERAIHYRQCDDPTDVWDYRYDRLTFQYSWQKRAITATDKSDGYPVFAWVESEDREDGRVTNYANDKTVEAVALTKNKRYVVHLRCEAERYRMYINWQTKRLEGWTPKPEDLIAV